MLIYIEVVVHVVVLDNLARSDRFMCIYTVIVVVVVVVLLLIMIEIVMIMNILAKMTKDDDDDDDANRGFLFFFFSLLAFDPDFVEISNFFLFFFRLYNYYSDTGQT